MEIGELNESIKSEIIKYEVTMERWITESE